MSAPVADTLRTRPARRSRRRWRRGAALAAVAVIALGAWLVLHHFAQSPMYDWRSLPDPGAFSPGVSVPGESLGTAHGVGDSAVAISSKRLSMAQVDVRIICEGDGTLSLVGPVSGEVGCYDGSPTGYALTVVSERRDEPVKVQAPDTVTWRLAVFSIQK